MDRHHLIRPSHPHTLNRGRRAVGIVSDGPQTLQVDGGDAHIIINEAGGEGEGEEGGEGREGAGERKRERSRSVVVVVEGNTRRLFQSLYEHCYNLSKIILRMHNADFIIRN